MNIGIIGGGVFGAMTAVRLAELGQSVRLFERLPELMYGASSNANRLHMGFHYPRDDETARQCILGYKRFLEQFEGCILENVTNAYFVSNEGSLTSSRDFLSFCDRLQLPHEIIDLKRFEPAVANVELGVMTAEVMFDPTLLRQLLIERLKRARVQVHLESAVTDITRTGIDRFELRIEGGGLVSCDAVVNCSYPEINRLTSRLGHEIAPMQYEYTAAALVKLDSYQDASVTILDGPFMSLMPFGRAGEHLLYHVEHSVIANSIQRLLDPAWLDPETSPFASVNVGPWFETLIERCRCFVPALKGARMTRVLQGPRMVLPGRENTDERPSIVTLHERGYVTAFSGKIDHCMWVADDVARVLSEGDIRSRNTSIEYVNSKWVSLSEQQQ